MPKNAMMFLDESHIMASQIGSMSSGDRARKDTLVEYGFRLPAARDNRPLKFEEWNALRGQSIFVSATPAEWELNQTGGTFVEQVVRPTGLIDPPVEIRPTENQVDDLMHEAKEVIAQGGRLLVTTLTKKMAEALTEYLSEHQIRVRYIHSDVDTLERIEIIQDMRKGLFDVLVGINLLREGLDIPECMRVMILDADKEGFLRSKTSLIQTIGRAARNVDGKAILYADKITGSMQYAIDETSRRREKQIEYNKENNITPASVKKNLSQIVWNQEVIEISAAMQDVDQDILESPEKITRHIKSVKVKMLKAAENLDFEEAARLRDQIKELEETMLRL